jgi:putative component of membrane protein insertase Oxa1/YidC/SpoIIIJ protein YidD
MSRIATSQGLHVSPSCSSQLVQPVEREPVGDEAWSVLLRCPECEVFQGGVFTQPELDAYDVELDRGEALLRVAYLQLSTENMAAEIDAFAAALGAGAVLPEDF